MKLPNVDSRLRSPDGRHQLVVYERSESSMGRYDGKVALLGPRGKLVESFEPLRIETAESGCWSDDSAHLAFPSQWKGDGFYLIWRLASSRFAVVRIGNPYPLDFRFPRPGEFEIEYRLSQLEALNSDGVFGGGRAEWPIQRFRRAEPLRIELETLSFRPRSELESIETLLPNEPAHDVGPIPDGFFPYHGPPLTSTRQQVNGRPLAGVHLEAFAEWGDPVAQLWLAELRGKRGERYDAWEPIAKALGKRMR